MTGPNWLKKHRPTLLKQFVELLEYKNVIGLCLCEVGNLSDLLDAEDRREFEELIQDAFQRAYSTGEGPAHFLGHPEKK